MAEFLKPKICILKVDGSLDDALLVLNKILGDIVNTSFNTNSVRKVVTEKLYIPVKIIKWKLSY